MSIKRTRYKKANAITQLAKKRTKRIYENQQ